MLITIARGVKVKASDYDDFKILSIKRKKKIGRAIGELIEAEVRRNKKLIKGDER